MEMAHKNTMTESTNSPTTIPTKAPVEIPSSSSSSSGDTVGANTGASVDATGASVIVGVGGDVIGTFDGLLVVVKSFTTTTQSPTLRSLPAWPVSENFGCSRFHAQCPRGHNHRSPVSNR
eukprot:CAMPEP_0118691336 /NCGR_PEP_ID=MMETSP0800-20121206/10622_1 /TAXON_ID=210618 ORGANISM="Striatella unipunctata, Strain CCMP2910" /NCGR_SAMPLE_ID=MMETSP0800 /ASSEMBLY_ACC=CAM_ASM_000638 /LENGTH=119 /DNA_ID=CAMNT_0006589101 /DNA_START=160 /DNA_END=516 /DNA_ORIENTATION=-